MQNPYQHPYPQQQPQPTYGRGKSMQNHAHAAAAYSGKNIYNGYNESRIRTAASVGKQLSQRDTRPTSVSNSGNHVVKSRGKSMLNYNTDSTSGVDSSQIRKGKGGKVMPVMQQQQQEQQQQQQANEVLQNVTNFAESFTLSNSSPSVAAIPSSSSSSLSTSSSGMTVQDWSGQEDMSRGEGGPPRVRYPAGGQVTSKPLFVDCSVEYELPKMAKIPADSLPLLMVHPKWQNNKPITRSTSQQQLHQQQQQPQVLQPVPRQFHVMQQQQQQSVYLSSCPQCPVPSSATSGRGRKRPHHDFQHPDDVTRVKRVTHNPGELPSNLIIFVLSTTGLYYKNIVDS